MQNNNELTQKYLFMLASCISNHSSSYNENKKNDFYLEI